MVRSIKNGRLPWVLAAGAVLALTACGSSGSGSSGGSGKALSGKRLCISSIVEIQVLDVLFDDMKAAAQQSGNGLKLQVVYQQGDIAKQINDIDQFISSGQCAAVATVTSVGPDTTTGWAKSAADAAAKKIGFFNFSSDYITGATNNISNPHYDPGFQLGVQAANWYKANNATGSVGTLSNVQSPALAMRTQGFDEGFKSVVPDIKIYDAGSAQDASAGANAASSLIQAHRDMSALFAWGADVPLGALQASKEAGKSDPKKFSVWAMDVSDAQIADIIGGKTLLQGGGVVPFRFCAPAWERTIEWSLLGQKVPPTASCIPFVVTAENGSAFLRASNNQLLPENAKFLDQSMIYFSDPVKTGDAFPKATTGFAWKGATTVPAQGVTIPATP